MNTDGSFLSIAVVSRMTAVPPHILRYWERQFPTLKPMRDQRGHRLYTSRDVEKVREIRTLVYREGYRIRGAKQRLREDARTTVHSTRGQVASLKAILKEIKEIARCLP